MLIIKVIKEKKLQNKKSKDYFLKLCGSGGGGYIIGFSFDLLKANNQLKDYNFQVLISY